MIFLYPNFLLFMVIPLIVLGFFIVTNKKEIDRVFSKEIISKLVIRKNHLGMIGKNILLFASMFLFILALARPVSPKQSINLQNKAPSFAVLLDISASMRADDIYPSRLGFAIQKIKSLISKSDAIISLYTFSDRLYMIASKTSDKDGLIYLVEHLNIPQQLSNSSNLYQALKNIKEKNILLFSDGTDIKDFKQIKKLNKNITTYLTATQSGSVIKKDGHLVCDSSGKVVITKQNQQIKSIGKLYHFSYQNDTYKLIPTQSFDYGEFAYLQKKELFIYPLGLGVLLLFFVFYSPKSLKFFILVLTLFLFPQTSKASVFDFITIHKAKKAYKSQNYKEAEKLYIQLKQDSKNPQLLYNLANTQYKLKKYKKALKNYKMINTKDKDLRFKTYINTANTLFRLKRYKEAYSYYLLAKTIKSTKNLNKNIMFLRKNYKVEKKQNQTKLLVKVKQKKLTSKIKIKTFMIPLTKSEKSSDGTSW